MQYQRNSEYLTVLCEKWYPHPTLHGNLVCNAGKKNFTSTLFEGGFFEVFIFMQEAAIVNMGDVRFYWYFSFLGGKTRCAFDCNTLCK